MTHVVTSACVRCKYQDCVHVCPVEAFREAEEYLVIDPDECIDCAACIPECPAEAIYADVDLPEEEMSWLEKNEEESVNLPIAEGDSPVLQIDCDILLNIGSSMSPQSDHCVR